jgi:RimJ/RimL family protein N-acetyltransferase
MRNYAALRKQVYRIGAYSLIPLRAEDRFEIMRWRNEQLYHLRQSKPLTAEDQDAYFSQVVDRLYNQQQPNQILFSFLKEEQCIGYGGLVHINWLDKNAEISFVMETELEQECFAYYWSIYLKMLEQVAFEELGLHKIFTFAFDLRPHLYPVLESCGYNKEAELADHCLIEGIYRNVIIHARINTL